MSMAEDTRKRPDFSSEQSFDSPREPGTDPLAELARLIGQSDPFNDLAKGKPFGAVKKDDRPAPEWLARPVAPGHDDYDAQPASHQVHAQPAYRAPYDPHAVADRPAESDPHAETTEYSEEAGGYDHYPPDDRYRDPPDDRYRVALPLGQHEPDSYYAEDGHIPPQGGEGVIQRRRGGLLTVAAVVGLAVIGTAGAFGYRAFTSGGSAPANPPVIKADPTPPKTVPAAPAPATTASVDQNKPFQDRVGAPAAPERVVPREEQPVSLPTGPAPAAPRVTAPQPSAQSAPPLVSPPPPTSSASEPKRVKTVTIRQDNSGADSAAMGSAPVAAPPAPTRTPAAKTPMTIAPDPSSRTKTAARTPPAQAAGGAYSVQLSAQKTEDDARASYQVLQQKYPSVLSGREPIIRRAELGQSGTWYRVHVGSFATYDQATALCNNLKDAGGQCIVQKN
ncbi:MAG: SPOR domain-containing protein [Alphaproteobacteria bacterium]